MQKETEQKVERWSDTNSETNRTGWRRVGENYTEDGCRFGIIISFYFNS